MRKLDKIVCLCFFVLFANVIETALNFQLNEFKNWLACNKKTYAISVMNTAGQNGYESENHLTNVGTNK